MPYTYSFGISDITSDRLIYTLNPLKGDNEGNKLVYEYEFSLPKVDDEEVYDDEIIPGTNCISYDNEQNIKHSIKTIRINTIAPKFPNNNLSDIKEKCEFMQKLCQSYGSATIQLLFKEIEGIDFSILCKDKEDISDDDREKFITFRSLLIGVFLYDDVIDMNKYVEMCCYYYVVRYISNKFSLSDEIYDLDAI